MAITQGINCCLIPAPELNPLSKVYATLQSLLEKNDGETCLKESADNTRRLIKQAYYDMMDGFEERCKQRYC